MEFTIDYHHAAEDKNTFATFMGVTPGGKTYKLKVTGKGSHARAGAIASAWMNNTPGAVLAAQALDAKETA